MPGTDKVRVVIVDDIAETRENIRRLLQFEADVEVIGAARTGKEAIEIVLETKPDVVLMDINMPDMDGIQATEAIRRNLPYVKIIILSVQGDPSYMRRAMLAGAGDFLTKPPNFDELSAAIRRAGALAHEERVKMTSLASPMQSAGSAGSTQSSLLNGKIIMVYSPKGGTGCTTIATNLAVGLKTDETKVALIDGNLQFGDIAVFLNEQGKNTILDLAPRVNELDPDIIGEVMITHSATGINILAAPSRPEMAEKVTGDQFAKVLQYLRQLYTFIIVDTSSYLTDIDLSVIDIADLIVLITTQEIPSIKNTKTFLSVMDGMRINRKRILHIMNRYDKRIAISPEKIGESLRQEIVAQIPLDERVVALSVNRGVPFMIDNKTQPIGKSIITLSEQIKETISKLTAEPVERASKK
jgi:pilus assembly protein CpaE